MKILYDPGLAIDFSSFGIDIPASGDRAARIASAARSAEDGGALLVEESLPPAGKEYLSLALRPEYLERLFGSGVEEALVEAYELRNADGSLRRYRPEAALRPLRELLIYALKSAEGSRRAVEIALGGEACYFLGGGAHHGRPDRGIGFCPINDVACACLWGLSRLGRGSLAWIVDVDAHKGDGTAIILSGEPRALTLSAHMASGWPLDPESIAAGGPAYDALIPSSVDIAIESDEEGVYIERLAHGLGRLVELSRKRAGRDSPDFCIVVDGSDPWEGDELPSTSGMRLGEEALLERDLLIHNFLAERGIAQAWLMAGGYGAGSWRIHANFLLALAKSNRR